MRAPDPEFVVQPYVLPGGQGYRHMTAYIDDARGELILYGGLGNGGPRPPTPMNHDVFTLDLNQAPADRDWVRHEIPDAGRAVEAPWFTSTRGFIELGDRYYLACDDTDSDKIYAFNPDTYRFEYLTESTLAVQTRMGDCCAVGVTIPNSRAASHDGGVQGEERIYILGGRNASAPVPTVRYYSVTDDRWVQVADLNEARSHLACAPAVQRGQPTIFAVGGGNQNQGVALRSMEAYDVMADQWTLYENYLPAGRTRQAIQNVDDKYLLLIGGDTNCAGGGANNNCTEDVPVTSVHVVDLLKGNRLLSAPDCPIPQLQIPRATPATAWRKTANLYELYVIGGRTLGSGVDGLDVEISTEVLTFDWRKAWDLCGTGQPSER